MKTKRQNLEYLSIRELVKLAKEEQIEIPSGCQNKADVIEVLAAQLHPRGIKKYINHVKQIRKISLPPGFDF